MYCLQKSLILSAKKIYRLVSVYDCDQKLAFVKIKGKMFMYVFFISQDKSISTSLPVLDLIDAIAPNAVRPEMIKRENLTDEDKLNNAK